MAGYLMNAWYMGAWAEEVGSTPISRKLLGISTMFFRKSDGKVVSMRDRCPHRFAPLSKGKICDDESQCPYHGLKFDASGQCTKNPLEFNPPRIVRVQTFPVVERDNIVWFWPGEPEASDPVLIPDFSYLSHPAYKHVFGMTHVNAHYELETDNLMDLSHVEMMHPPFGGVLGPDSKYKAYRIGNQVRSDWFSSAASNPPVFENGPFPTHGEPIDQWLEMRWDPPGSMYLAVAVTRSGLPRDAGYTMPSAHIITPETEHSTFYFWAGTLHAEDKMPLDMFRQSFIQTFENEDRPMIEAVSEAMAGETDRLAMRPLLLRSDGGTVLSRRVLADLIHKERELKLGSSPTIVEAFVA